MTWLDKLNFQEGDLLKETYQSILGRHIPISKDSPVREVPREKMFDTLPMTQNVLHLRRFLRSNYPIRRGRR